MELEPPNRQLIEDNLKQVEKEISGVSLSKDNAEGNEYSGPSTPTTPLMDTPDASVVAVGGKQSKTMVKSFDFSSNRDICTTEENSDAYEESSSETHEDPIVLPFSPDMLADVPLPYESNLSSEDRSQLDKDLEGEQRGGEDESSSSSYQGDIESDSFISSIRDDSSSALTLEMPQMSQDGQDMSERFGEISPIIPLSEGDESLEALVDVSEPATPQVPSTPTYLAEQRSSVICSRELCYDEAPPTFNVEKLRSLMFGMKKGRPVPSQAKPPKKLKKYCSVMKDCGSVKLEAVERYRPEFSDLVAVQTIDAHKGFVWVVAFSTNGKFLATGGQDGRVCVWSVGDMVAYTEINVDKSNTRPGFGDVEDWEHGVIRKRPSVQTYSKVHKNGRILNPEPIFKSPEEGNSRHSADVTTLSWTRDGLLLSGSLDGTVRLWKIEGGKRSSENKEGGGKCISRFACQSGITSVVAHPIKPQHFVCGAMNETLHVWNIGKGELFCSKKLSAVPTAIMFTRDGATVLLGLSNGTVQIRNSTMALCSIAKVSPGYKITGLAIYRSTRGIVVSSADSAVRSLHADGFKHSKPVLSSVKSISKVCKMNGHTNKRLPIIPSISEDERFVISGSEDGYVYVWDASDSLDGGKSSKAFTGFERWAVSEEGTVATHAQFFPQNSVDRCVAQTEHFRRIQQLLDSEGTAKAVISFKSPMPSPACQASALKGPSKGEPCSGQQRAMIYGHAHQDASNIRAAAVNSGDIKGQRRSSDTAGSYQIDGDQRSSTALLQGWRKMQRGGDTRDINGIQNGQAPSAAPRNAIVIAAEASGRLVIYAKSSIVSEFRKRLDLHV